MKKRRITFILLLCWLGYFIISTNLVLYSPYYLREQGVLTEQVLLERFVKDTSYVERFTPENIRVKKHARPYAIYNTLHEKSSLFKRKDTPYYNMMFTGYSYEINESGNLYLVEQRTSDNKDISIEITEEIKQQFKHDFYLFMEPITDNPTKPLLDLQWLYNLIYPRK
ncbi:MAG: hypothetical protein Q4B80_00535 [Aerococcaceae bacterium]|nr:hypothetical protein [Aerococcaceae bacterium]